MAIFAKENGGGEGGEGGRKKPSVEDDRIRGYIGRVHIYIAKTFLVPPKDLQRCARNNDPHYSIYF